MKKVLVFGTFDGLHQGHLNFFEQAKRYGEYLIVVVSRDKTVKRIKKHLPFRDEKQRLREVQKCKLVNEAKLGYLNDPYKIIREIKPDIICLGYDQKVFTENLAKELKKGGLKTKIYRMKSFKPKTFHSSIIKKKHLFNEGRKNFNK